MLSGWSRAESKILDDWVRESRHPELKVPPPAWDPQLAAALEQDIAEAPRKGSGHSGGAFAPEGRKCAECKHPICTWSNPVKGMRRHRGRGLCTACYARAWSKGKAA